MKKIYSVLSVLLTIILMGVFVSCERDKEVMLTAVSITNEQITPTYKSATISSTISSEATIRDVFVQYTVTKDFAEYDEVPMQEKDGIFTAELIDLQDNTTYYYRYAASNRHSAIVLQKIQQFATLQPTVPAIRLDSILTVWDSYAQVQVALEFDGGASVTDMGVCWGTQANPTIEDIHKSTKDTVAVLDIPSLQPNTQYYVRAYAVNKVGVAYSEELVFTTYALPEVRTEDVSDIQVNSALLSATLVFDGNDTATIKGFCWSDKSEPTIEGDHIAIDTASAGYTYALTALLSETQYFVRAYAQNKIGIVYGEEKIFTTSKETVSPTVTTAAITQITETSAVAGGNVTSDGNATVTERGVVYGIKQNPTTDDNKLSSGSGTGEFTCNLANLQPNTIYYVRAYATNEKGTAYGEELNFTTSKQIVLPTVTTNAVTQITETTAVAGGNVTSDGNATVTERGVVYSTKQNPTISDNKKLNGSGVGSFVCDLSNLQAGTTYYVRAYAINNKGTAYGDEVSFTTAVPITLATVTTASITNITETSAVVGGNVTSDGGASVTERGVVYATTQNPTTADNKVSNGSGMGTFTCNLTDLQANTTYYVRAYAINEKGTAYGEEVSFTTKEVSVSDPTGTENGYGYVDLGLSVKWATCNVGATKPEEYGDYYAWGEVEPKSNYILATYKYNNGSTRNLIKYNTNSSFGKVDNITRLELLDDVAYIQLGDNWRMPTYEEWVELRDNCTWEWNIEGGVLGCKVTSKINEKSIFLPAAGCFYEGNNTTVGIRGYYWSSSLDIAVPESGWEMRFESNNNGYTNGRRFYGNSVRPVYSQSLIEPKLPTIRTLQPTQITETSVVVSGNVTHDGGSTVTEYGIVYNTSPNPTTLERKMKNSNGISNFSCNLIDLQPGTTYYVRAYATNSVGTAYGEEMSFTTETPAVPEYVDLGLSVKWATFNVGANSPEDYGDYFAWGETEPKEVYDWSTYKWCNGSSSTLTKYNTSSSYGIVDNKTQLDLTDDAAHVNWGGSWRMPTREEWSELREQCTWTWTSQNGVNGRKVTSKSNGNSIFLPAAGYRNISSLTGIGSTCYYWSSSPITDHPSGALYLYFSSSLTYEGNYNRFVGLSVRPVWGEYVTEVTVPTITTATVTQITETSAVAGGNVTSDGGASVSERGVCIATGSDPTTAHTKITSGNGTGSFTCNLTGLQPNTTYYVRAYAVNSKGTAYGEEVSFTTKEQSSIPSNGTENGHEYVDLGLSVKWATCNVGASYPEDYGDYFAWGETTTKSTYNWSTYKHCNNSKYVLKKYNTFGDYGVVDNKTILELSDDAAHVNMGGEWRMPTETEWAELREQCTWTWSTQDGINGYKVISNINGNSIFFPTAGCSNNIDVGIAGYYWSIELYTTYYQTYNAYYYHLSSSQSVGVNHDERYKGMSIRAVCP